MNINKIVMNLKEKNSIQKFDIPNYIYYFGINLR